LIARVIEMPSKTSDENRTQSIHRVYTEDFPRKSIIREVGKLFENFTLQSTTGFFKGHAEASIIIEIIGAKRSQIRLLAARIREISGQKSVLILSAKCRVKKIEGE
jgi:hypothetical protein